jgi:hypothetical protein
MQTLVTQDTVNTYPNLGSVVRYLGLVCEGQSVTLVSRTGKHTGVQVIVENASHRCWRGMGRHFATIDDAISHYKSAKVRAALQCAKEILSASH